MERGNEFNLSHDKNDLSSIPVVPIPPGNSGAFSHTFHPGGRALAFHPITPGAFDHLTFLHYNIVASSNDQFIGKLSKFLL